jgi:hypothetical protein
MISLPLDRLPEFERRLERMWLASAAPFAKRRDALAISLGLCGLRWEEVSRVLVCDVDVGGRLAVRTAKGGIERSLPIGARLASALALIVVGPWRRYRVTPRSRIFRSRTGKPLLYAQVKRRLAAWAFAVWGRPFTFHCLRHTAAVRCYNATHDVLAVQRLLGHRSLQWTETYLRSLTCVAVDGLPSFCDSPGVGLRLFDPTCVDFGPAEVACLAGLSASARGPSAGILVDALRPAPEHDCLAAQVRTWVADTSAWNCTCRVCGRFLGFLPDPAMRRASEPSSVVQGNFFDGEAAAR